MSFSARILGCAFTFAALACSPAPAGHAPNAAQTVTVDVAPAAAEVQVSGTARFAATVTGTADTAVVWSVPDAGGGSVDAAGLYTAPAAPGTFHVRATSHADAAVHADATVTVVTAPVVTVTISPRTASVVVGGSISFSATVANAASGAVTWSVPTAGCGTITGAGVYTAPATAGACTVRATSQAEPSASDVATVTVTAAPPPIVVAVTPSPATADACRTVTFSATVTGTTNRAVTWSVQEGAAGGTISAAGVYTAPASAGTYHVVATSQADATRTAVAAVTVSDRILSVAVSPPTIQLAPGATQQFTATVTTTCGTSTATRTIAAPAAGPIVVR